MSKLEQTTQDILELNKLIYNTISDQTDTLNVVDNTVSKLGNEFLKTNSDIKDSHEKIIKYNENLIKLVSNHENITDEIQKQVSTQKLIAKEIEKNKEYFTDVINAINKANHKNTETHNILVDLIKTNNTDYTNTVIALNATLTSAAKNIEDATNIEKLNTLSSEIDNMTKRVENLVTSSQKESDERQKRIEKLITILMDTVSSVNTTNDIQNALNEQVSDINSKLTAVKVKVEALYEAQAFKENEQKSTEINHLDKDDKVKVGDEHE